MTTRMQQRRGTSTQWTNADPVLAAGEIGFETNTNKFKIGDGVSVWSALNYFLNLDALDIDTQGFIKDTQKGIANGVASLDANGILPTSQLPQDYIQDHINTRMAELVGGAPETLNTLNEIAAAFNNNPGYADSVSAALDLRAPRANPTFTGVVSLPEVALTDNSSKAATTHFAKENIATAKTQLETLIATVSANVGTLDGNLTTTNSRVTTAESTITGLQASVSTINSTNTTQNTAITGLTTRISGAEADITALETLTVELDTRIDNNDTTISTLQSSASSLTTSVAGLGTRIDNHDTSIASLQSGATSLTTSLNTTNGKVTTAESNINTLKTKATTSETHQGASTNVHGIENTANLATKSYADNAKTDAISTSATAIALKANIASPTFTGTVTIPEGASISGFAPLASPALTGTPTAPTATANTSTTQVATTAFVTTANNLKLNLAGGTMTGALTLSGAPTSDLHAATKLYVDGIAAGINFHQAVKATTTTNLSANYNNGTLGLGATLTADTNRAFTTLDGVSSWSLGDRVLVKDQTTATQNGIYTLTTLGSGSAAWVLTRATDADNNPAGELATGDFCFVTGGSTNGSKGFIISTTGTITIGTTNVNYTQFNASEAITAGTGITKSGSTISIGTGAITSDMILDGTIVDADINATAAIAQSKISGLSASLSAKADLASPTFTGTVALPATSSVTLNGTALSTTLATKADNAAVINTMSGSHTLVSADVNNIREMSNGGTLSIPANDTFWPIGATVDILQTGSSQVTISGNSGVTVNATPGLKLRAQWSSATILKRAANTFVVMGDLTA
jgi:predicted  nucleic acid-binding Zn-ribbon protein